MKTLFLVASLAAAVMASADDLLQRQLEEENLWRRLDKSVAALNTHANGSNSGVGALIDARGWFIAHSSATMGAVVFPGTVAGAPYQFTQLAKDEETQLVLLQANGWQKDSGAPIRVSAAASQSGERILAVTTGGPVWGELGERDRVGNLEPSKRYAPLNEIRLEKSKAKVDGALAFNERGELLGILGAMISEAETEEKTISQNGLGNAQRGGSGGGAASQFGPGELTIGYAYGPKLLDRVVQGFLTPGHNVQHPSIGVYFKKAPQMGALIESVVDKGPAAKGGMEPGDLVIEANGQKVRNEVQFATILFNLAIGDELDLKVRRQSETLLLKIKVGAQMPK